MSHPKAPASLWIAGAVWLGAAVALGASGVLQVPPRPVVQGILVVLTLGACLAAARVPSWRAFLAGVDPRWLVALHLTRFVGLLFPLYYARGQLPWAFAIPGGVGDAVVAAGAAILCLRFSRGAALAWNVVGLVDILLVVATAARAGLDDPGSVVALTRLPLCLLPTFLVPLIIASHLVLFVRLRRA